MRLDSKISCQNFTAVKFSRQIPPILHRQSHLFAIMYPIHDILGIDPSVTLTLVVDNPKGHASKRRGDAPPRRPEPNRPERKVPSLSGSARWQSTKRARSPPPPRSNNIFGSESLPNNTAPINIRRFERVVLHKSSERAYYCSRLPDYLQPKKIDHYIDKLRSTTSQEGALRKPNRRPSILCAAAEIQ